MDTYNGKTPYFSAKTLVFTALMTFFRHFFLIFQYHLDMHILAMPLYSCLPF